MLNNLKNENEESVFSTIIFSKLFCINYESKIDSFIKKFHLCKTKT